RGLPPGLEENERFELDCPPDCHCQKLLRAGRIARAVNVVECSRLDDTASAHGDTGGLLFHASVPLLGSHAPDDPGDRPLLGILNVATAEWQFLTSADLQFLTVVGTQLTAAIERAWLYDTAHEHIAHFQRELLMARDVQASLIPRDLPRIDGFQLAAE